MAYARKRYRYTDESNIAIVPFTGQEDYNIVVSDSADGTLKRITAKSISDVTGAGSVSSVVLRNIPDTQVMLGPLRITPSGTLIEETQITTYRLIVNNELTADSILATSVSAGAVEASTMYASTSVTAPLATFTTVAASTYWLGAISSNGGKWDTTSLQVGNTNENGHFSVVYADGATTCTATTFLVNEPQTDISLLTNEDLCSKRVIVANFLPLTGGVITGDLDAQNVTATNVTAPRVTINNYATYVPGDADAVTKYYLQQQIGGANSEGTLKVFAIPSATGKTITTPTQISGNGIVWSSNDGRPWVVQALGRFVDSANFVQTGAWSGDSTLSYATVTATGATSGTAKPFYIAYTCGTNDAGDQTLLPSLVRLGVCSKGYFTAAMTNGIPFYSADVDWESSWVADTEFFPTYPHEFGHQVEFQLSGSITATSLTGTEATPMVLSPGVPTVPSIPSKLVMVYAFRMTRSGLSGANYQYRVMVWNRSTASRVFETSWTTYIDAGMSSEAIWDAGFPNMCPLVRTATSAPEDGPNQNVFNVFLGPTACSAMSFSDKSLATMTNMFKNVVS